MRRLLTRRRNDEAVPGAGRSVQPRWQAEALEGAHEPSGIGGLLRQPRQDLAIGSRRDPRDEGGHAADPRAAEGQHVERERKVALLLLVPAVEGERRLSVRASSNLAP